MLRSIAARTTAAPIRNHRRARPLFGGRGGRGLALLDPTDALTILEPKDAAQSAGLRYVCDDRPGIRRKRSGSGFSYVRTDGSRLCDRQSLRRIRSIPIPPPCTDLWPSPFP